MERTRWGTRKDTPNSAPFPYTVAKIRAIDDNELGCRGASGIQGSRGLPVEWIAEAEEAGLGARSPARGLANGGGLGAAPPARRGPGPRAG